MNEEEKLNNAKLKSNRSLHNAEQPIVTYLRAHPEFFNRHLDLLETLRIPHSRRPAVSLIERQLLQFRERNAQLRKKLTDLVEVAQENGHLVTRMQRLTIMLIKNRELKSMLQGIKTVLRDEFNGDFVTLKVTGQAAALAGETCLSASSQALFESVLRSGRPQCGQLNREQVMTLFGEAGAGILSVALVPLRGTGWCGLLGVGSKDQQRFHPAMGTLFLNSMGELISQALQTNLCVGAELGNGAEPPAASTESE